MDEGDDASGRAPALPARATTRPQGAVTVRSRSDDPQRRLDESRARLREALIRFNARTNDLTPAAQVRAHPWGWVWGGFAVGLWLGWRTRHPHD